MRSPFTSNGGFEGELSPEDLFNMFFGGGFGGGGFGNGGVQFGQFGGGGFGGQPSTWLLAECLATFSLTLISVHGHLWSQRLP